MKKSLILCACLISVSSIAQADHSYKFIGLGLGNNSYLSDSEQIKYSSAWTPSIAVGAGYHFDINENYSVDSELSIDYSQIDFNIKHGNIADYAFNAENNSAILFNNEGKAEAIGLWATVRLNRHHLFTTSFAEVSPFVEMSVGKININHQGDYSNNLISKQQSQITAYKTSVGLTFDLKSGNSFSLALGTGNTK